MASCPQAVLKFQLFLYTMTPFLFPENLLKLGSKVKSLENPSRSAALSTHNSVSCEDGDVTEPYIPAFYQHLARHLICNCSMLNTVEASKYHKLNVR